MSSSVNDDGAPLVVVLLEHAMHRLRAELYELSDTSFPGLRTRHYRTLSFLPPGGARLSQLTAASGLTKQAMAQALAPLERGGYVDVVPDPTDGRARIVRLTERGRTVNAAVRDRLAEVERGWADQVGAERYAVARAVLAEVGPPDPDARADGGQPDVQDRSAG